MSGPRLPLAWRVGLDLDLRIVEVGTHYGGSARALAEGQRAAGLAPNVLTYDVEDRAGRPIVGVDGVERVLADIREPEGQARLVAWAGTEPVDLVYIDALKDAEFVESTVAALGGTNRRSVSAGNISARPPGS